MRMANFSLYKKDSSWLYDLLYISLLCLLMFVISVGLTILNIQYLVAKSNETSINKVFPFEYDVIAFPVLIISVIIQVISLIYFIWCYYSWLYSFIRSGMGYKGRKLFNFVAVGVSGLLFVIMIIDSFLKIVSIMNNLPIYLKLSVKSPAVAVGSENWMAAPYLLLVVSLFGTIFFFCTHFLQKALYKSENYENSLTVVQDHYRKIEAIKQRKHIIKHKQKDLSKKIRVF